MIGIPDLLFCAQTGVLIDMKGVFPTHAVESKLAVAVSILRHLCSIQTQPPGQFVNEAPGHLYSCV